MTVKRPLLYSTILAAIAFACPALAARALYDAVDIGSLGGTGGGSNEDIGGYCTTYGAAISNGGVVVGNTTASNGKKHAFSWTNGVMTDLGTLSGGLISEAEAISPDGMIVGWSANGTRNTAVAFSASGPQALAIPPLAGDYFASGINAAHTIVGAGYINAGSGSPPYESFVYSPAPGNVTNGNYILVTTSGGTTGATGINPAGAVVGGYALDSSNYFFDAFIFANGVLTSIAAPNGGWVCYGLAINDAGTAVGYYSDPGTNSGRHAFSYAGGMTVRLGALSGGHSWANAINNEGDCVGGSTLADGSDRAVLFADGSVTDLNTELAYPIPTILLSSTAINDAGQIVAQGADGDTYLLTPVPEPESLIFAAAALALCARRVRSGGRHALA